MWDPPSLISLSYGRPLVCYGGSQPHHTSPHLI
uniref:Uncharacterized protein n=1 Tax=Anguilla anguilla TaxID=7936 RepID=A0A0E9QC86_ANGAN